MKTHKIPPSRRRHWQPIVGAAILLLGLAAGAPAERAEGADKATAGWKDTRWTGVMEKRGGKWLIVQMHFSHASK